MGDQKPPPGRGWATRPQAHRGPVTPGLEKTQDPGTPEGGPVAILPRDPMPGGPQITNRDRAACLLPSEASGHQTRARFDVQLLQRDRVPCKHARGGAAHNHFQTGRQQRSDQDTALRGQTHARTHSRPSRTHARAQAPAPGLLELQMAPRAWRWASRGHGVPPPPRRSPGVPACPPLPRYCFGSKANKPAPLVGPAASGDSQAGQRGPLLTA